MKNLTRRDFLKNAANCAALLALQSSLKPSFLLGQSAQAGSNKNLVIVNLLGGLDGLAALPYFEGELAQIINSELRPTIFVPSSDVIPAVGQAGVENKIGFHRAFQPLTNVALNRMKIIQSYGIPGDPGRSHDQCQILMSLGASQIDRSSDMVGFMARLMDSQNWDTLQYWSLSPTNHTDVNTRNKAPVSVTDLSSFNLPISWYESEQDRDFAEEISNALLEMQIPRQPIGDKYNNAVSVMKDTVAVVRRDIASQRVGNNALGNYSESGIGVSLRDAAKILKAKNAAPALGLNGKDMLILMGQGGYDTHSDQFNPADNILNLPKLLGGLARNLAVFYRDLQDFGILDNTIIIVYSEFGRTSYQNGRLGAPTVGTDHGHASNTFVLGGPVTGGVVGDSPTTLELRDRTYNAQRPKVDYRDIFSDALNWLGVSPESVFDDPSYTPQSLGLFR